MTLSVVVPFYNHYDLLHQCLWDLYKNCGDSIDRVLVVNDASTDDTVYEGLHWWKEQKFLPLIELRLEENVGFLRASNKGMKKAEGDILILLSTDVRVMSDFCVDIKRILIDDPKSLVGNRLIDFDSGWNTFNGKTFKYLEGWLLACTKDGWKELGGFDEIYAPSDFEDVDLSTRAAEIGYALVSMNNDKIWHLGGQSIGYTPEREAITRRNQEKFKNKWVK